MVWLLFLCLAVNSEDGALIIRQLLSPLIVPSSDSYLDASALAAIRLQVARMPANARPNDP